MDSPVTEVEVNCLQRRALRLLANNDEAGARSIVVMLEKRLPVFALAPELRPLASEQSLRLDGPGPALGESRVSVSRTECEELTSVGLGGRGRLRRRILDLPAPAAIDGLRRASALPGVQAGWPFLAPMQIREEEGHAVQYYRAPPNAVSTLEGWSASRPDLWAVARRALGLAEALARAAAVGAPQGPLPEQVLIDDDGRIWLLPDFRSLEATRIASLRRQRFARGTAATQGAVHFGVLLAVLGDGAPPPPFGLGDPFKVGSQRPSAERPLAAGLDRVYRRCLGDDREGALTGPAEAALELRTLLRLGPDATGDFIPKADIDSEGARSGSSDVAAAAPSAAVDSTGLYVALGAGSGIALALALWLVF